MKITLCGRAPMEHTEVPPHIPKQQSKFYRDAIVAYQSGKTLAGLFYLRTVIEQFIRSANGPDYEELKADEAIERYIKRLPDDFKKRFPTLKPQYEKLSSAIHAAKEDAYLFDTSLDEINKHFQARQIFEL